MFNFGTSNTNENSNVFGQSFGFNFDTSPFSNDSKKPQDISLNFGSTSPNNNFDFYYNPFNSTPTTQVNDSFKLMTNIRQLDLVTSHEHSYYYLNIKLFENIITTCTNRFAGNSLDELPLFDKKEDFIKIFGSESFFTKTPEKIDYKRFDVMKKLCKMASASIDDFTEDVITWTNMNNRIMNYSDSLKEIKTKDIDKLKIIIKNVIAFNDFDVRN